MSRLPTTPRWPITGWRSTSTSAASSTRFCIFSIRVSSPARCASAAISVSTSPSPASSPRAWWCTRPIAARRANGSRPRKCASRRKAMRAGLMPWRATSRSRSARPRKCRSPSATPSIRTRSSRPTARTRRDGSCCPIRRPSATSSGPKPAFRARSSRPSACGA